MEEAAEAAEEEEEGAGSRTRGRLHCETAISRDEAFLNKQITEGEGDQYGV